MAQDVGPEFPGATPTFTDPETGRALVDYTPALARGQTVEIEDAAQASDEAFGLYRLDAVSDDEYTATPTDGATTTGIAARIAKPWHLRKTVFDGQEINGRTYEYLTDEFRRVRTATDVTYQRLEPPFDVGSELLQAGPASNTGVAGVTLFDVNTAGRYWHSVGPLLRCKIVSVADDYLNCTYILPDESDGDAVKVMKPWALRRSPFDGLTVDGVAYVYQSATQRTADGSDVYLITPNYWVGAEILVHHQNQDYTVGTLETTTLLDVNVDARAWALNA